MLRDKRCRHRQHEAILTRWGNEPERVVSSRDLSKPHQHGSAVSTEIVVA